MGAKRDLSSRENKDFWKKVEQEAESAKNIPDWKRDQIELHIRHGADSKESKNRDSERQKKS